MKKESISAKVKLQQNNHRKDSYGEFLFQEFDERIGFFRTFDQHLVLKGVRRYAMHTSETLLRRKFHQMLVGYDEDNAADQLTNDPVSTQIDGMYFAI